MTSTISRPMLSQYLVDFTLPAEFSEIEYNALLRVVIKSHLHGYLAYRLHDTTQYPPQFVRHLHAIKTFCEAQYIQSINACRALLTSLQASDMPILFLKGAAYIAAKKPNAHGRLISDVDILVERQDLKRVEDKLAADGWMAQELDDYDEKYYREWSHELPPYIHLETGLTLDIHHNLLPGSAGKSIDIIDIMTTKQSTELGLFVPSDVYLILHSAVHLLLNDDIEKGLRDCLDLHSLLLEFTQQQSIETVKTSFINADCEDEFYVLISLLHKLFGDYANPYALTIANTTKASKLAARVNNYAKAIFPESRYLADSKSTMSRFAIYFHGHLSKMPMRLFIKHIVYKAYRTLGKKLFGEYVFKKDRKV